MLRTRVSMWIPIWISMHSRKYNHINYWADDDIFIYICTLTLCTLHGVDGVRTQGTEIARQPQPPSTLIIQLWSSAHDQIWPSRTRPHTLQLTTVAETMYVSSGHSVSKYALPRSLARLWFGCLDCPAYPPKTRANVSKPSTIVPKGAKPCEWYIGRMRVWHMGRNGRREREACDRKNGCDIWGGMGCVRESLRHLESRAPRCSASWRTFASRAR